MLLQKDKKKGKKMKAYVSLAEVMLDFDKYLALQKSNRDKADFEDIKNYSQFQTKIMFYTKEAGDDKHTHLIIIDRDENGVATLDGEDGNKHGHEVKDGKILKNNGHVHTIDLGEIVWPHEFKHMSF